MSVRVLTHSAAGAALAAQIMEEIAIFCVATHHMPCVGGGLGKTLFSACKFFLFFFFRDARFRLAFVKISQKNLNHSLQDMVCSEFCLEFSHPESCTVNRRAPHKLDFPLNCQFFEGYLRELTTSDSQFLHSTCLFLRETTFTWVDT